MSIEEFVEIPVISASDPSVGAPSGWCHDGIEWYNTSDKCLYRRSGSSWTKIIDAPATADHTHTELGAVSFTGNVHFGDKIYAGAGDSNQGINKTVTIPDVGVLTFKKGLLVQFDLIVPP